MRLFCTGSKNKYRIFLDELETNNLIKIFGNDINIRNKELCRYFETRLPSSFDECNNKRIMVLDIAKDDQIYAVVLTQDVDCDYENPKRKGSLLKFTNVSFSDKQAFKNWLSGKDYYYYKKHNRKNNKFKVVVLNMTDEDEMSLANAKAKINATGSFAKFFFLEAGYRLGKIFY